MTTINYSDIQGGYSGTGNLNQDPFFINPKAGNFRLLSVSSAINTGDPATSTSNGPSADLDSTARIVANRIDMGAYEFKDRFGPGTVVYVTSNGNGDYSGSSWANALPGRNLQQATVEARNGSVFWVAAGTYKPTTGADRELSFWIPSGGQLYGGFNGTETILDQRNITANTTILSGDIGVAGDKTDNAYNVVRFRNASTSTRLDGVTIRDGNETRNYANLPPMDIKGGGGIYNDGSGQSNRSAPTIANCRLLSNEATYRGGAVFNDGSNSGSGSAITLANCQLANNRADRGGALFSSGITGISSASLVDCSFTNNSASIGGALYATAENTTSARSDLDLTNCLFQSNSASSVGGGIYMNSSTGPVLKPTFRNCLFARNSSSNYGGALYMTSTFYSEISPVLLNCTVLGNSAGLGGRNIYSSVENNSKSTYQITNTIVRGGSFESDNGNNRITPTYNVTYSNIQGGFSGIGNIDADPMFVNAANGDFRLKAGSPSINTGDPNSTTATVSATDLVGNKRVAENRIDMGAYEFQVSAVTGSDLSLRLSVDTRTQGVSQAVTYRLTVTNDGPLTATGVTWRNRLPDNMAFIGGSNLSLSNGVLSGSIASLEPGASSTFSYQLQPTQAGQYINAAQITAADQPDPDSQPNSGTGDGQDDAAQVDIRVGGASSPVYVSANPNQVPLPPVQSSQPTPDPSKVDLALSMSVNNRVPKTGDLLTYVLTITNQGGATATNVRVTAYLPDGQQFEASSDGLSGSDGGVSGGTASIPAGGQVSVRFTARVTASKMGITRAQIRQASPADVDSTPDNGTDNGEDDTAQIDLRSLTGL